jgi:DNA-binding CsgD family transcriptional regulator
VSVTPTAEILGRTAELARLRRLIEDLPDTGSATLVHGEAGIGKSVLLDAVRTHAAARGTRVLATTGMESETHLPYSGLHEVLRPVLVGAPELPGPQQAALLAAFGELEQDSPPEPFLISLAALNLLAGAAARQPVLLAVDDIQWLDGPSHDTLAFLARRVTGEPIAIVAALRDGYDSPYAASGPTEIEVRGLDDETSRQLVALHGPDLNAADRERILQHALGNPLALVELPGSRRSGLDDTNVTADQMALSSRLERAFAGRLHDLPDATRDALLVAAVDSDGWLQEILAAATAFTGIDITVEALTPAIDSRLVRVDQDQLAFRHPLVRSGILQSESLHRRQRAHRALADVLADDPFRRTWHLAQATIGKDDYVADELENNHVISIRRGSVPAAIAALERSAQLTTDSATRGRRLLLAAEHAFGLGRADMVDRLLSAAGRNSLTELERARMEWLREIFNDGVPGDATRVLELCEVARRSAQQGDTSLALNLLLGAALRCWWAHAGEHASRLVVTVADELIGVDHTEARFIAILAVAEPNQQSPRVRRMLNQVVLETVVDPDQLRLLGMAAHAIGDPVLAIDFLDRAEGRLREQGRLGLLSHVLTMGIGDRVEIGDHSRAESASAEGRRIAQETGQPIWDLGTLTLNAMLLGVNGQVAEAHRSAAQAEHLANGRRLNDLLSCVQLARGFAFCSEGQYAEAYAALRRVFDPDDPAFHQSERFHGVMYLAEAAVHSHNQEDARRIIADLIEQDQRIDSPMLRMQLKYAVAVLADDTDAEKLFEAALSDNLVRWPLLKARLELAYGSWLRRQRRVADSRMPLRAAQVALDVIGARAWADLARSELRAAGQAPHDSEPADGRDLLSPQELQIARLVAEGQSNRQIGERLYLSPRTIGSHLYRLFPKLGVTSRAQLAARANDFQ